MILNDKQLKQLDDYAAILADKNQYLNLTGIVEYEQILDKHFYDSILLSFHKNMTGRLLDVGSGAGFPGVVLKICYPELEVVLLEPIKKRCVFLEELITTLDLKGISVVNKRGEDFPLREDFDYVTARAVSNLNILLEVCGALVKVNGYFIALRGKSGLMEIENAAKAAKTMGLVLEDVYEEKLFDESDRVLGFYRKTKPTEKKYPRKYNIIKEKPL